MPDLVVTLTTPADARPYSAVKLFVKTLISWTESSGTVWPTVALNSSLFAAPSSRTFVPAARNPFMLYPAPRMVSPASVTLVTLAAPPTRS